MVAHWLIAIREPVRDASLRIQKLGAEVEAVTGRLDVLEAGEILQVVAERLPLALLLGPPCGPPGHERSKGPHDDGGQRRAQQEQPGEQNGPVASDEQ